MRETRACLICITHWTFEYIDGLSFPDVREVMETYIVMKGGKRRAARPEMPRSPNGSIPLPPPRPPVQAHPYVESNQSLQERQMGEITAAQEGVAAMREKKHITTQPFWIQQSFAARNEDPAAFFDRMKKK